MYNSNCKYIIQKRKRYVHDVTMCSVREYELNFLGEDQNLSFRILNGFKPWHFVTFDLFFFEEIKWNRETQFRNIYALSIQTNRVNDDWICYFMCSLTLWLWNVERQNKYDKFKSIKKKKRFTFIAFISCIDCVPGCWIIVKWQGQACISLCQYDNHQECQFRLALEAKADDHLW